MQKNKHLIDLLCRWLLAAVFWYAGIPKLFALNEFARVVDAYGILPESLVLPAAFIVVVLEIVAGAGLIFKQKFGLYLSTLLMGVFIAVLTYGIVMGLDIDCGCFAPNDPEYVAFSGLRVALVRDLFLLVPLLYLYLQSVLTKTIIKD